MGDSSAVSKPWRPLRSNHIVVKTCCGGRGTVCFHCSRSGTTSKRSTADPGVEKWISSLPASHVNLSPPPENGKAKQTKETCGRRRSGSFAKFDRRSRSWKTYQLSLLTHILEIFSEIWPRAGMLDHGTVSQRPPSAPIIEETGYGFFPTPRAQERGSYQRDRGVKGKERPTLTGLVKMFPTPCAQMGKGPGHGPKKQGSPNLQTVIGGSLNPPFVEWLMGFPIGWTDLKPLEAGKFRQWLKKFGGC